MARMWFERGSAAGDRECHNGLGVIWRDGLVLGQTNEKKALAFFNAAAAQELAEAQVNLGKYYYSKFPRILVGFVLGLIVLFFMPFHEMKTAAI